MDEVFLKLFVFIPFTPVYTAQHSSNQVEKKQRRSAQPHPLHDRHVDYIEANDKKEKTENDRRQAYNNVEQLFTETRAEHIAFQLAAEQAFPHTALNGVNNAIRAAFDIPVDQPATK